MNELKKVVVDALGKGVVARNLVRVAITTRVDEVVSPLRIKYRKTVLVSFKDLFVHTLHAATIDGGK
jgi:hypothetical protein